MVYRGVEIGQVHGRDPDGAFGDGLGVIVPPGVRLLRHGGGERDRSARVSLGQPQKFGDLFPRIHVRSLARNPPIDIPRAVWMYQTLACWALFGQRVIVRRGLAMPNGQSNIHVRAHPDQLVVGLSQLDQALKLLEPIDVSWLSIEKNHALKLALVTLDEVPEEYIGADGLIDVDRLIAYLREVFLKQTGRPLTIGKNRIVGAIVGSPYVGGGEGIPTPYVGGGTGIPTPYVGGGGGPYVGGGQPSIQLTLSGTLPKRTEPPGKDIAVGILDTRLFAHPDLAGRYLASHGTLASEVPARPPDQEAHATFIAGVVLQRAPNANLIVDHVLNESDIATSSWEVATKMVRFADAGVKVLNISFGAATADDKPPLVLTKAVETLRNKVVVVAAAGNNGPETRKIWPAALAETEPNVVAVGAGEPDRTGDFVSATFSPDARWVGLIAPGENIYSTYKAGGYATWSGTSFAAAAVSGAVARLIEATGMSAENCVTWLKDPPDKRAENEVSALMRDIGPRAESALR